MRQLLDKSTQRRLAILEELNERPVWVNSKELAELNKVTLRTIANDITYLKEKGEHYFKLETSKKNGVRIRINNHKRLAEGYAIILRRSDSFHFIEQLFFHPHHSVESWAEKLFLSESTIYRVTNQMKDVLEKNHLTLQLRPCQLTSTSEGHVRQFYAHYFTESYHFHEWPYELDKKTVVALAYEVYQLSGLYYDEFILARCAHLIAVSITRYQQGFFFKRDYHQHIPEHALEKMSNSASFYPLLKKLNVTINHHFLLDFINGIYFLKSLWLEQTQTSDLADYLTHFLSTLSSSLAVEIDENSRAIAVSTLMNLHFKYQHYPNHEYILFDRYKHKRKGLVNSYPNYVQTVETHLKELEARTQFPWYSNYANKVLYWLMITWQSLPTLLERKRPRIKLLIFNHSGRPHAELLKEMIQANFPNRTEVTIFNGSTLFLEEADLSLVKQFDLIISSFSSPFFPEKNTILIEPVPTKQNWETLYDTIKHLMSHPEQII